MSDRPYHCPVCDQQVDGRGHELLCEARQKLKNIGKTLTFEQVDAVRVLNQFQSTGQARIAMALVVTVEALTNERTELLEELDGVLDVLKATDPKKMSTADRLAISSMMSRLRQQMSKVRT